MYGGVRGRRGDPSPTRSVTPVINRNSNDDGWGWVE